LVHSIAGSPLRSDSVVRGGRGAWPSNATDSTDTFIVVNVVSGDMASSQRIPVSERTRDELREIKAPGQTYDELLQEFIEQKRRERLAADVKAVFERADDPAKVIAALEDDEFDRALELMGLDQQEADALADAWKHEAAELADPERNNDTSFDTDAE
jgi:hypothetical protein